LKKCEEMKLSTIAEKNNVEYIDKGDGHIQLKGVLLVNYYPESKQRTAYINGMKGSTKHVTPEQAVKMATERPMKNGIRDGRRRSYKRERGVLLKKHPFCHWCKTKLTKETATIEHLIPLGMGGINNMNNYALACEGCNHERGCNMPELKGE